MRNPVPPVLAHRMRDAAIEDTHMKTTIGTIDKKQFGYKNIGIDAKIEDTLKTGTGDGIGQKGL